MHWEDSRRECVLVLENQGAWAVCTTLQDVVGFWAKHDFSVVLRMAFIVHETLALNCGFTEFKKA